MPTHTVPGPLDGSEYRGKTTKGGFTVLEGGRSYPTCRHCGTSLYGRRESRKVRTIGGRRMTVEKFRCPGGHGLEVRRPLEVAA